MFRFARTEDLLKTDSSVLRFGRTENSSMFRFARTKTDSSMFRFARTENSIMFRFACTKRDSSVSRSGLYALKTDSSMFRLVVHVTAENQATHDMRDEASMWISED